MFKVIRTLTILSLAFSLLTMSASVLGKTSLRSVHSKFAPVEMPKGAGPVSLDLAFMPMNRKTGPETGVCYCKEAEVRVVTIDNLQYFGDTIWTVKADSGVWSDMIINVIIPPNDISGIRLMIKCGRILNPVAAYFVTTGDTVEFYPGKPSAHEPTPPRRSLKTFIDTLTEEQLQTRYEVIVELKKPSHRKFVERFVGSLKDSTLYDRNRKYYKLWITLQNLIKIGEEGIECGFVTPPPWDKKSIQSDDSLPKNKNRNDSSKQPQGSLPSSESNKTTELVGLGGLLLGHGPERAKSCWSRRPGRPQLAVG